LVTVSIAFKNFDSVVTAFGESVGNIGIKGIDDKVSGTVIKKATELLLTSTIPAAALILSGI